MSDKDPNHPGPEARKFRTAPEIDKIVPGIEKIVGPSPRPLLVDEFARGVADQTDAIWAEDPRTGNKHARRSRAAFQKLREIGNTGRDALSVLLTHDRPDVRVAAAAHLLRYRNAEAMAVLREAANGKGLVAFEASEAIKRWEEGNWALDPPTAIDLD